MVCEVSWDSIKGSVYERTKSSLFTIGVDSVALSKLSPVVNRLPYLQEFGLLFEAQNACSYNFAFDLFVMVLIVVNIRNFHQLHS